ncbi:DUF2807 domain-containing protein [Aureisphaera galaxeae]|uniref:GIN domain-containing protein n=1 Tax=Aureisphaera galaxeae TaxID=1538023 RepID=UPI00234FE1DE|nr:DUF2807 domain-containing protein [Aureisphaera galaxeae]MDC8002815.1 DUF2807 domain-containing protein [Aureisphaera galaxeae]
MNQLFIGLCFVGMTAFAQVKGNQQITTVTLPTEGNLTALEMGLYARVEIDASASSEFITITGDSNLIPLIDTEVVDGTMKLTQTEWIQPSQDIEITMGAPNLKRLQVGVHETVLIENVFSDNLNITVLLGKVIAIGKVNKVSFGAENGEIDASQLAANEVNLNIWGRGKAIVNATETLTSTLSDDARLELIGEPKSMKGDTKKVLSKKNEATYVNADYISFKIKNNSWNRHNFVVIGPKKDGSSFSYGFPMMPGATKKERWTVGTKVYKRTKLGMRKLLVTITEKDAGTTLNLFN